MQELDVAPKTLVSPETHGLIGAEVQLAKATKHLRCLRQSALCGGRYDPDEYDQAVLAYRQARAAALTFWAPAPQRGQELLCVA